MRKEKIWGIELTGRTMWYAPWPTDSKGNYRFPSDIEKEEIYCVSGEAVNETLLYFEECGGNTGKLIRLLNKHVNDKKFHTTREMLLDKSRWYNNEFYFYFIMFSKKIIGRYDFHFGEKSSKRLSVYHGVYEKGFIEKVPWGKDENGNLVKESSSNIFLNIYEYLHVNYSSKIIDELIELLNAVLKKQNKVMDVSYCLNKNYWFSEEIPAYYYSFVSILTNDNRILYKVALKGPPKLLKTLARVTGSMKLLYKNIPTLAQKFIRFNIYSIKELRRNSCILRYVPVKSNPILDKYQLQLNKYMEQLALALCAGAPSFLFNLPMAKYIPIKSISKGDDYFEGQFIWENKRSFFNIKDIILWLFLLIVLFLYIRINNVVNFNHFFIYYFLAVLLYYSVKKNIFLKKIIKSVQEDFEEINQSRDELTLKLQKEKDQLELKVQARTKEINNANQKLKKIDTLKNEFIANITHDFRSPLTVILNIADLGLRLDNISTDQHKENYNAIYNASLRLQKYIDKLLDLAKLEAKGMAVSIKKVNIIAYLNTVVDFYTSSVLATGIKINFISPESKIDSIYTDIEKLDTIISNILSNAIKFVNPSNGIVTISLIDKKKSLIIKISDNGIGIPKDKLKVIFDRFAQVSDRKENGSGIGLAFAKQLAELIKGRIWAKSNGLHKGATFFIELKKIDNYFTENFFNKENEDYSFVKQESINKIIKQDLAVNLQEDKTTTRICELNNDNEYNIKKALILIIEDDNIVRNIIMQYLIQNDYQNFIIAPNGKLGLNAVYGYNPDIILCDLNMPVLRGDALHDEIAGHPNYKNIPFVFLSAIADIQMIEERKRKGASDYLKKPINEKDLIITIENNIKKYFEYKKVLKLVTDDELTGLYNYSSFIQQLKKVVNRKTNREINIVFFDVDNFSYYNEKYGYKIGDKILQIIGEEISFGKNKRDFAARYSGDKFLMVLLEINEDDVKSFINVLKERIAKKIILIVNEPVIFSCSFGIASLLKNENYICKKLQLKKLEDYYKNNNKKSLNSLEMVFFNMAKQAHDLAKINSKDCGDKIVSFKA